MRGRLRRPGRHDGRLAGVEGLVEPRLRHRAGDEIALLPQRHVHRPVVTGRLGELAGAVERVDDPDPVALEATSVVLALLAEHHVAGTHVGEQAHQQLVRGLVAGVLELLALEPLLAHLAAAAGRPRWRPRRPPAWSSASAASGVRASLSVTRVSLDGATDAPHRRTTNGQASSSASKSNSIGRSSKSNAESSDSTAHEPVLRSTWFGLRSLLTEAK